MFYGNFFILQVLIPLLLLVVVVVIAVVAVVLAVGSASDDAIRYVKKQLISLILSCQFIKM